MYLSTKSTAISLQLLKMNILDMMSKALDFYLLGA